MASPNTSWSEIVTTTLANRSRQLADNVSDNNALLRRLKARGKVKPASGGRTIVQELEYAENSTYTRYSGYETLNISPSDVFSAAEYSWRQAAVAVTISGLEMLQNSGKDQMIDLLESRIGNAERTMMNNMSTDIYSNGTGSSGKQIDGLQLMVSDDPDAGTVGGIDKSANSFWNNQLFDFSSESVSENANGIQSAMNTLYLRCARGPDSPDLIIFDNTYYGYYWASLQAIQRVTSSTDAAAGFTSLRFMGADVVFDGGQGGACPASHGYFLNTNYLFFRPHRDRNMIPLDPDRFATNQDAMVKLIAFAGNMTASNLALQGVMIA